MRETKFKSDLVEQAQISNGSRVLDVGCGTGTLAIMIKRLHPEAEVVGIDADVKILAIAPRRIQSLFASSYDRQQATDAQRSIPRSMSRRAF